MITEHICSSIQRKSLLYKSRVEYGSWTINHVEGCKHGCRFPCYAFMMSKRFGRVSTYEEWLRPKIIENSIDLLKKEFKKYKDIDYIHLSFMTDPFMYNSDSGELVPEIKELTLEIIKLINSKGIRVTVLTKGLYPDDLLENKNFSLNNEYGVTLVSLNEDFRKEYEPYTTPYEDRLLSLYKLHRAGFKTWVSIEPYPGPDMDYTAFRIEDLLHEIKFVDKLIFGKMNYNSLAGNYPFYEDIARKVINFCRRNNILLHIKEKTPLHKSNSSDLFRDVVYRSST